VKRRVFDKACVEFEKLIYILLGEAVTGKYFPGRSARTSNRLVVTSGSLAVFSKF
jgi:hypothetical protein